MDDAFHSRALVVDDNSTIRIYCRRILGKLGFVCDEAADGVEAVRKTGAALEQGLPYQVVLMDITMPRMNGIEATRQIMQQGKEDERPVVIAVTANTMEKSRATCLGVGMKDYIEKPFVPVDLFRALRRTGLLTEETARALL